MEEDGQITRVEILIEQQRYAEAEKILSELITQDSTNIQVLFLLSEVNLQQEKLGEAMQIINLAIGLSPTYSLLFYIKARIYIRQEKLDEALINIEKAIEIEPDEADYFALLGNIKLTRKKFEEALTNANKALELDPESIMALNLRSTALIKLNRKEESFDTIEGALNEDPNDPYTHANYGWGLLEKGDHKKAMKHFKEALSLDPNLEYAKSGMLESIKATNILYRWFLKYSFWMGNLTGKYQWGVIIGFYLAFRGLTNLSSNNENLQPYLIPLLVILGIAAFSTWIISPISDLVLRFSKYGKFLLNKKERLSSNIVALCLIICVAGLLGYFAGNDDKMLMIAIYGFAMILPLGTMLYPSNKKNVLLYYALGIGVIGLIAISTAFTNGILFNFFTVVFVLAFVGYQWVANFILIKEDNY